MLVNMSVDEWDAVIRVHLRGVFCPVRHAIGYWRDEHKAERGRAARIVTTTSGAGLRGSIAQSNYVAAKAGIAAFTINAAAELARYGVVANTIAPSARSRMTEDAMPEMMARPETGFDAMDPANVSPFVVWLGSADCDVTGRAFEMAGGDVCVMNGWNRGPVGRRGAPFDADRGRPGAAAAGRGGPRPRSGARNLTSRQKLPDRSSVTDVTEPALASDGRVIGARAHRTRRRLLDATAKLLEERGALGVRVVDITREVGTSPATFYQYFPDVEEAILVLADEATDDIESLRPYILTPWNDEDGVVHVQEFVAAFMEYWDRHRVILRVRDLRAEEGDDRFWAARRKGYAAIIPELTVKIESAQTSGRVSKELNSYAAAAAAMAMLERLLTYRSVFRRRGVTKEAMAATLAAILYETVTGHPS